MHAGGKCVCVCGGGYTVQNKRLRPRRLRTSAAAAHVLWKAERRRWTTTPAPRLTCTRPAARPPLGPSMSPDRGSKGGGRGAGDDGCLRMEGDRRDPPPLESSRCISTNKEAAVPVNAAAPQNLLYHRINDSIAPNPPPPLPSTPLPPL